MEKIVDPNCDNNLSPLLYNLNQNIPIDKNNLIKIGDVFYNREHGICIVAEFYDKNKVKVSFLQNGRSGNKLAYKYLPITDLVSKVSDFARVAVNPAMSNMVKYLSVPTKPLKSDHVVLRKS